MTPKETKRILISTGGGDCPGLNAVIRAVYKAANKNGEWEVWGSREAFNGVLAEPSELIKLNGENTAGIHVKGGTILKTTNKGNPLEYPVQQEDGSWTTEDRSQELVDKIRELGFHAVINVGGDGSQRISQALFEKGLNIVGVPKTIDNDLSATDISFGFSTAVQVATDSLDKLVTTAESHHRVMIMEVMGRHAGWIALYTAIAGGAEVCLIPEIPYNLDKVAKTINSRYDRGRGFINIVVAEGAKPQGGEVTGEEPQEKGAEHIKLGGVCNKLKEDLKKKGIEPEIRTTILGHIQRGGTPIAYDRILATAMGVQAFNLVREGAFGRMVSYSNHKVDSVKLSKAARGNKFVSQDHYLVRMAKEMGVSFGD